MIRVRAAAARSINSAADAKNKTGKKDMTPGIFAGIPPESYGKYSGSLALALKECTYFIERR